MIFYTAENLWDWNEAAQHFVVKIPNLKGPWVGGFKALGLRSPSLTQNFCDCHDWRSDLLMKLQISEFTFSKLKSLRVLDWLVFGKFAQVRQPLTLTIFALCHLVLLKSRRQSLPVQCSCSLFLGQGGKENHKS